MKKTYIRPEMEVFASVEAAPLCVSGGGVTGSKESLIEDVLMGGVDEDGTIDPSAPLRGIIGDDDKLGGLLW